MSAKSVVKGKAASKKSTKKISETRKIDIAMSRRSKIKKVLSTFRSYNETGDSDFDEALKNASTLLKRYDKLLERRIARHEAEVE